MFRSFFLGTSRTFAAIAALCLLGAPGYGQVIEKATDEEVARAVDTAGRMGMITPEQNDRRIVRWLAVDNRMMVEFAELAAEKATDKSVKRFAQMVADEHRRHWTAIESTGDAAEPDEQADSDAKPGGVAALVRDEGRTRCGGLIFRPTDFVKVKEEVCRHMHEQARDQFEKLEGAEFDRAFTAHMLFAHEGMIATIEAVDDGASARLQPRLKGMAELARRHLSELEKLDERFRTAETARRGETTNK